MSEGLGVFMLDPPLPCPEFAVGLAAVAWGAQGLEVGHRPFRSAVFNGDPATAWEGFGGHVTLTMTTAGGL